MTTLAVLSDIHGNLPALQAVKAHLAGFSPDAVIVAGDMINVGPHSQAVLEFISAQGWTMMRGNHEFYLLHHRTPREPAHWQGYTTPRWLRQSISPDWQRRLAVLPDALTLHFDDAPLLYITHGLPNDPWTGVYPDMADALLAEKLAGVPAPYLVTAHIHLQFERVIPRADGSTLTIINPGSAGLPLDGIAATASYVLLTSHGDRWEVQPQRIPYDVDALLADCETSDYLQWNGVTGLLYMDEFRTARMRVWPFERWKAEQHPHEPNTRALVDEFLALGDGIFEYYDINYWVNLPEGVRDRWPDGPRFSVHHGRVVRVPARP